MHAYSIYSNCSLCFFWTRFSSLKIAIKSLNCFWASAAFTWMSFLSRMFSCSACSSCFCTNFSCLSMFPVYLFASTLIGGGILLSLTAIKILFGSSCWKESEIDLRTLWINDSDKQQGQQTSLLQQPNRHNAWHCTTDKSIPTPVSIGPRIAHIKKY